MRTNLETRILQKQSRWTNLLDLFRSPWLGAVQAVLNIKFKLLVYIYINITLKITPVKPPGEFFSAF